MPLVIRERLRVKRSAPFEVNYGCGRIEYLSSKNRDSLQGDAFDLIVVDEAATEKDLRRVVEQYLEPMLIDRGGQIALISTPKGHNEFWEYWNDPGWSRWSMTSWDNPHIDHDSLRELEGRHLEGSGFSWYWRQEMLAEFVFEVGRYFGKMPELSEFDPLDRPADICAIDYGYTDPLAAVWIWRGDGCDHVLGELYQDRLEADEQAEAILKRWKAKRYVRDPSTPGRVVRIWRECGLTTQPFTEERDRVGGWMQLRWLINRDALRLGSDCTNLWRELREAEADPKRGGDITDGNDHLLDALRYGLLSLPLRQRDEAATLEALADRKRLEAMGVVKRQEARLRRRW